MTIDQQKKLDSLIAWHDQQMKKSIKMANFIKTELEEYDSENSNYRFSQNVRINQFISDSNFHLESFRLLVIIKDTYYDR